MKFLKVFVIFLFIFPIIHIHHVWASDVTGSVTVTVLVAPDLIAEAPSSSSALTNTSTSFNSTITNQGNYSTQWSFGVLYQLKSAADGGGSLLTESAIINRILEPGQSSTPESSFNYTFASAGTYSIRACADMNNGSTTSADDNVNESNEDNNCSSWTNVVVSDQYFTVSTSAGLGCSISPTSRTVDNGEGTSFTVTPNLGYSISSVSGCNGTLYGNNYNTGSIMANCTVTVSCLALPITGSITSTGCSIAIGDSFCRGDLSWSTTNAIETSKVTTPTNVTVSTANSNSMTYPVSYGTSRTFYLYNNGNLLDQTTMPAPGCLGEGSTSVWTGSYCATIPSGNLTASNCTISAGNNSCNSSLSWSTTNAISTSAVTTPTNITVATANSSSATYPVNYGSRTFYLYNYGYQIGYAVSTASCAGGTSWNGSACSSPSGNISATSCSILAGSSSCSSSVSWSIASPISPSIRQDGTQFSTATSSSGTSRTVSYGSSTFSLYDNGSLISSSVSNATCALGTTWTGFACATIPSGNLTASNCTISAGNNSCNSSLSWSTTNAISTSAVTTPTNITVATANSSSATYPVNYGSRTFYLYNYGYLISQATSNTSCEAGTTWDGNKCNLNNTIPNAPIISGNSEFAEGSWQSFGATGTDPDGDTIRYGFDWNNDNSAESWTSPYVASGTTMFASNSWAKGTFTFRALTQDIKGANSPWSDPFTVTVTEALDVPEITYFEPDKNKINVGQSVTLTWTSDHATSCTMTSSPLPSVNLDSLGASTTNNHITFKPSKTTVYSLICHGPGGDSAVSQKTVNVGKIKPTMDEF